MIHRIEVVLTLNVSDEKRHPGEWDWRKILPLSSDEDVIVQSIRPLELSDEWH